MEAKLIVAATDQMKDTNVGTPQPTSHSEKKRKIERKVQGKVPSKSLKIRKAVHALAIPTNKNTIR
jgi:hypothetical protein